MDRGGGDFMEFPFILGKEKQEKLQILLVAAEAAGVTGTNCIRWNLGGSFPCRKTTLTHLHTLKSR